MNIPTVKVERNPRFVNKARHLFALVVEVGNEAASRYGGLDRDGKAHWLYLSAPKAHSNYRWYVPGEWFNAPAGERVLSVHLYREDGKSWHKDANGEEVK